MLTFWHKLYLKKIFCGCSYLFLYSKGWLLQENRDEMVGNPPTSDANDLWGGAGGWLLPSPVVTELLKRDWDLPGAQFDDRTPFWGRFMLPDDDTVVSVFDTSGALL